MPNHLSGTAFALFKLHQEIIRSLNVGLLWFARQTGCSDQQSVARIDSPAVLEVCMQYHYRQATSCTTAYHPFDIFKGFFSLMGKISFFLLVGLYSTTVLTLQFLGFILKNAPKFILLSLFYVGLALLCVVISSFAMAYMLMALLAGLNINI